ncbi:MULTISPECIES: ABC transporter permease [unclassified Pseudactinotalea]|uniref:ABC transporter permease n=1 Tax=unclassified Pseudactinotalea TaxID=2649176 RepID=UPI00128CD798|nr:MULTISPECIES: ABC transporter permease [unclassified Pseudactinotalea]MPV49828.1 ABC transporter permease [Pseudactinotalea sp. HY160]QGH69094.1 ABC transporter permease [Pseudactinotalea sp. HY158]
MTTSPAAPGLDHPLPPAGRAANPLRRVLSHAGYEARTTLRNGEQLLLSLVLPALLLVFLAEATVVDVPTDGGLARIDVVAPGVLALAVMSSAFTGQAIATGFDRRAGALRMFATTPLGRGGLLGGKIVAVVAVQVVQLVVLGGISLALGWRPALAGIPAALVSMVLGTAAFTALALLLAGTLRAEAVLAGANLLWVLLLAGGGILLPGGAWTSALPSGALGDGLRLALGHGDWSVWPILVLSAWTALLTWACVRLFRWS